MYLFYNLVSQEGVGGAGDREMAFKLICSVQKTLAVLKKQTENLVLWCDTLSNTKKGRVGGSFLSPFGTVIAKHGNTLMLT